jgi:hypothetical protein
MKDPRAAAAESAWQDLFSSGSEHRVKWDKISKLIRPTRSGIMSGDPSLQRSELPLSSGAIIAANNHSAALYGTLTNQANKWFGMGSSDDDLNSFQPVKEWHDIVGKIILNSFSPTVSTFYSSAAQFYGDISAFGNAGQGAELNLRERRITDQTISLAEICYAIDGDGRVIETIRKFRWSAVQAAFKFGIDALPEKMRELALAGSRQKFVLYHHVYKNRDWIKGRLGPTGKQWHSIYTAEEGGAVLSHKGFNDMPFLAGRWHVDTGETYGDGPGWLALPSAVKMELMEGAIMRAGQRAADPTMLAPDRDVWTLNGAARPGGVVYGGVDVIGRQMLRQLDTFSGTGITLEMQDRSLAHVNDAFHANLLNLVGRTGVTPIEVIDQQEQRLRMMAPQLGRIQEEYLAPKIGQRFTMLWNAGQIPPPPPEARGSDLVAKYTSAAAMAAKSAEGAAVARLIQDVTPLGGAKPRLMDRLSEDDLVEILADARGVPARALRSREEADEIAKGRAEQQQSQELMQAMQAGGGVARDLAAAQAAGST